MLDVEFLTDRVLFTGTVIYRYRSGLLRPAIFKLVQELSDRTGEMHSVYDCDDLILRWEDAAALCPGIRICDLPAARSAAPLFKRLKPLFGTEPGQPTLILMRAANYNEGRHSGTLVVDEQAVCARNVLAVLRYLAQTSDLPGVAEICDQHSFQKYFRGWINLEGEVALPDLVKEFERSILLYSEPGSVIFNLPAPSELDPAHRAFVVKNLSNYLRDQDIDARAALLQALAVKVERGWSDHAILNDIVVASWKVLSKIGKSEGGRRQARRSLRTSLEAASLWCVLVLAWANRISSKGSVTCMQTRLPISLELDHLCHEFEERLLNLVGDPLNGRWSDLIGLRRPGKPEVDEDDPVSDPICRLSQSLLTETGSCRSTPWLVKLHRLLSAEPEPMTSIISLFGTDRTRDLLSFGEVVGQGHVVAGIRQRFRENRHARPLVLSGPPGSGKQTIATLYARALLCEASDSQSIDPCGSCLACRGFSRAGGFGYAEFDLSVPGILEQSVQKLYQFRFQGFSERRVIVLKNADYAVEVMDAFLKTMEDKKTVSTYVVLAREERHVRVAALSRGARFRLQQIADQEARDLIRRWLPSHYLTDQTARLVALHGEHRPGLMWHLAQLLAKHEAVTLTDARALFDLGWGERTVRYLNALLAERSDEARKILHSIDVEPTRTVAHLRTTMALIERDAVSTEAAFLDLDYLLRQVRCAFAAAAAKQGTDTEELWCCLARHWLRDVVVDSESLSEAGREAELIPCGLR